MRKQRTALPVEVAARVQRQAESLKAEGAQRVLVIYEEAAVRMYADNVRATPPPPTRKTV